MRIIPNFISEPFNQLDRKSKIAVVVGTVAAIASAYFLFGVAFGGHSLVWQGVQSIKPFSASLFLKGALFVGGLHMSLLIAGTHAGAVYFGLSGIEKLVSGISVCP